MMSSGHSKDAIEAGAQGVIPHKQLRQQDNIIENGQEKKSSMSITSDEVNYLIFR
jgi:hypothetical protein